MVSGSWGATPTSSDDTRRAVINTRAMPMTNPTATGVAASRRASVTTWARVAPSARRTPNSRQRRVTA